MKLIHEQSKLIPRLWLDDVFFVGILIHGLAFWKFTFNDVYFSDLLTSGFHDHHVEMFDFKGYRMRTIFYEFSYFKLTLHKYDLNNDTIKFDYSQSPDYFIPYHLIIMHTHRDGMQINNFTAFFANLFGAHNQRSIKIGNKLDKFQPNKSFDCVLKTLSLLTNRFVNCKEIKNSSLIDGVTYLNSEIADCAIETTINVKNCIHFGSNKENLSFFYVYFYHFCMNFWLKVA
jgi:hypothetical protein